MKLIESKHCFGGQQNRYTHDSAVTNCTMTFSAYLPPQAQTAPVPALYWLSGLTCTDENFSTKAGAQRMAAELGVALIIPDTSPRGEGVADDPDGNYDLGLAASFYVDATQDPWKPHYQMYSYMTDELPKLVEAELPVTDQRSIFGHSMGGHGALMIALRNPGRYAAVSAFSPIVNPAGVPWGQKALRAYLGDDGSAWAEYDAVTLIGRAKPEDHLAMLVDQGSADEFLEDHLKTDRLVAACRDAGYAADIRMQPGYDHSYFFIASFIEQHIRFHAKALGWALPSPF